MNLMTLNIYSCTTSIKWLYMSNYSLERSSQSLAPQLYKIVVTHQAEKSWMYDRSTVQGATFNMRRQLNCGHANVTALSSSPVVSGWGKAFETCGEKKNASSAFRLG